MAVGHPPTGGKPYTFNPSSFPPLPAKISGNTSMQNNPVQEMPTIIQPTYAEFVKSKPLIPIAALPHLPDVCIKSPTISEKNGVKAIIFRQEEIEASMLAFKYALVARFYGERPSVNSFEHFVNSTWGLQKPAVVGLLDPRHIMVRLSSEEDFIHAWTKEGCFFNNARFLLLKWNNGFTANKEIKRAVWIELQHLPVIYHSPSMLSHIGNNIGHFLKLDERTKAGKHPIAPRLCIELDFTKPLPKSVWVGHITREGIHDGQEQEITYDFRFSKCHFCKLIGHETVQCPKRDKSISIATKPRPAKKVNSKQAWVRKDKVLDSKVVEYVGKGSISGQSNKQGKSVSFEENVGQPAPTPLFILDIPITSVGESLSCELIQTPPLHISEVVPKAIDTRPKDNQASSSVQFIGLGSVNYSTLPNEHSPSEINPEVTKANSPFMLSIPISNKFASLDETNSKQLQPTKEPLSGIQGSHDILAPNQALVGFKGNLIPSSLNHVVSMDLENTLDPTHAFVSPTDSPLKQPTYIPPPSVMQENKDPTSLCLDDNKNIGDNSNIKTTRGPLPLLDNGLKPPIGKCISDGIIEAIECNKSLRDHQQESDLNQYELAINPYIKMVQDSSEEQAAIIKALSMEPIMPTDQEVKLLLEGTTRAQPPLLHYVRKATQRHIKASSEAKRVIWNSVGHIESGMKWADVIDSEEEQ